MVNKSFTFLLQWLTHFLDFIMRYSDLAIFLLQCLNYYFLDFVSYFLDFIMRYNVAIFATMS
jgi:hypothetical protein